MVEDSADPSTSKPTEGTYDLACIDCDYTDVIEGTQDDVLDAVEAHSEDGKRDGLNHFVEFERR